MNRRNTLPLLLLAVFEAVAVTLWLTRDNIFYLFNFSYIGGSVALGLFLLGRGVPHARRTVQLLVGLYMLAGLGILGRENMQLEGFWYFLFSGVFQAAVIHYAVAKIFGPLLFGRGWCGYACWTAMVLDFLPYRRPRGPRRGRGPLRYVLFLLSIALAAALFLLGTDDRERVLFWLFLAGNALYFTAGILLAFLWKDNRAFCKYLCPITVFLKPMSYWSLSRIKADPAVCTDCRVCHSVCPMEVDMTDNARSRENGTECILCMECVRACPHEALHL